MEAKIGVSRYELESEWDSKINLDSQEFSVFQSRLQADHGYSRTRRSDEFNMVVFSSPDQRSMVVAEKTMRLSGEKVDTVQEAMNRIESQWQLFSRNLMGEGNIKSRLGLLLCVKLTAILHPSEACHIPLSKLEKLKVGKVSFGIVLEFERARKKEGDEAYRKGIMVLPDVLEDKEESEGYNNYIHIQYMDLFENDAKNLSGYIIGTGRFICGDMIKALHLILDKEGQA